MADVLRILIVEDSPDDVELLLDELRHQGFNTIQWKVCETEAEYCALLDEPWDVILSDVSLPQFSGHIALAIKLRRNLDIPFIFVAITFDSVLIQRCMEEGCNDFLSKDRLARLGSAIRTAIRRREELRLRDLSEAALRVSEERYRTLINTLPGAIVTVDKQGTILFASLQIFRILGWQPEELRGRPLTVLIPERLQARHLMGFTRYLKTLEPALESWQDVELDALHKDSREIPVKISFAEIISNGGLRFLGMIMDDSEHKAMERQLQTYREQLQEIKKGLNQEITDLRQAIVEVPDG